MDVVSLAPVPVSSLLWRRGDGPWTLAIVCKLTFLLRPERSALAKRQEPIHTHDLRTAELPADRILAPADRIPGRSAVDVTVFAPGGDLAGPIPEARLAVGTIDKRVRGTGSILHDFAGFSVGTSERPWSPGDAYDELVLPETADTTLFQSAPRDLRLFELAPDAELVLERLHPDHPSLKTRLPNVVAQAFVERDGERRELPMRIDGLWIDARRGLACLTFRAQLLLVHREEAGKVFVAVAGPDRRVNEAQVGDLVAQLRGGAKPGPSGPGLTSAENEAGDTAKSRRGSEVTGTSVLRALRDDETSDGNDWLADAAPPWLRRDAAPAPRALSTQLGASADATAAFVAPPVSPSTPPPASLKPPPPPPSARAATVAAPQSSKLAPTSQLAPTPPARAPLATTSGTGAAPPMSPWMRGRLESDGPRVSEDETGPEPPREPARAPEAKGTRNPREIVELLWFDADATPTLRKRFTERAAALEFEPADPDHDLAASDPEATRAHHTHFGLLTEVNSLDVAELRERMRDAVSPSGRFTPPILALAGELLLPFDAVEHLRALAGAMRPLVGDDRKLAEALASVEELLASRLAAASTDALQKMQDHLRRTFRDQRRAVSSPELDEVVTRSLLVERRYQRRTLLGGEFIRALFTPSGSREAFPCYLPAVLERGLPLVTAVRVKLLAEAHVRLDQYETARIALRAVTLGRIIEL